MSEAIDTAFVDIEFRMDALETSLREMEQAVTVSGKRAGTKFSTNINDALKDIKLEQALDPKNARQFEGSLKEIEQRLTAELATLSRGTDAYRERAQQLADVRGEIKRLGDEAPTAGERLKEGVGAGFKALPAIAAAGVALAVTAVVAGVTAAGASALNIAQQANQGVLDMQAQLGLTAAEAERLGGVAKEVFANNWGGSLTEAQGMVIEVRKQIKGLSDEELPSVTQGIAAISDTFKTDFGETTQAVNSLMKNFGLTGQQAMDFIAKGMQDGLNASGDYLASITEYSPQLKEAGASAEEFYSIMKTGQAGGVLGVDKAGDLIKEFVVRLQDGSKQTSQSLQALGIDQKKLLADLANGTIQGADALGLVLDRLRATKDQSVQTQAGVGLLGTQFEDLTRKGVLALDLTATKMGDLKGATDQVAQRYNTLPQLLQGAGRQFQLALEPVGQELLKIGNDAIPYIKSAIQTVAPIVAQMVRGAVSGIQQFKTTFGPVAAEGVEGFKAVLRTITPYVMTVFNGLRPVVQSIGPLFQSVFTFIGTLWNTVLRPVLQALAPAFQVAFNFVASSVKAAMQVVTGVLNAVSALMRGDLSGAVKAVQGIFTSAGKTMGDAMQRAGTAILDALKGLPAKMGEIASNIVAGLANGIKAGVGRIGQAARDLASGLVQSIGNRLRVQSPSRVMHDMGGYVVEGLAQGIEKTAPKAQQAAAKLAGGVVNEVAKARTALEKDISFDGWVRGLRSATVAQLEHAQAVARSNGETDKYKAISVELERRVKAVSVAHDKAAEAAKKEAEAVEQGRKAIADARGTEAYIASLRDLTDAELALEAARQEAVGHQNQYNAVLAEQKTRAQEAAQAVSDLADAEIKAAFAAGRLTDTQGQTDSVFRQMYGADDAGLIKALAQTTGLSVEKIRADVFAALDDAKRFAPEVAKIIERVWADQLQHRKDVAAQEEAATKRSVEMADDARAQIVEKYQAEAAAADDARLTVEYLTEQMQELVNQGRDPNQTGFKDYLTDLTKGTGEAAANAQTLLDNWDAILFRAQSMKSVLDSGPSDARGVRTPASTPSEARGTRTTDTVTSSSEVRGALNAEEQAWKTKTEAEIYAKEQTDAYRNSMAALTLEQLKSAAATELAAGHQAKYDVIMGLITDKTKAAESAGTLLAAAQDKLAQSAGKVEGPNAKLIGDLENLRTVEGVNKEQLEQLIAALAKLDAQAAKMQGLEKLKGQVGQVGDIFQKAAGFLGADSAVVQGIGQLASGVQDGITAFAKFSSGDILGGVQAAFSAVMNVFNALDNLNPQIREWKKNLLEVAEAEKKVASAGTGMFKNVYADLLSQDAAARQKLAGMNGFQRWIGGLFGTLPQVMSDEKAKLLTSAGEIFADIATTISQSMDSALMNAFETGDWTGTEAAMEKSLNSLIAKMTLKAMVAASGMEERIKAYAEARAAAMQDGEIDAAEQAKLNDLWQQILAGQKAVAQQWKATVGSLPGYGQNADQTGTTGTELSKTVTVKMPEITSSVNFDVLGTLAGVIERNGPRIEAGGLGIVEGMSRLQATVNDLKSWVDGLRMQPNGSYKP